jgi:hypothetical protein
VEHPGGRGAQTNFAGSPPFQAQEAPKKGARSLWRWESERENRPDIREEPRLTMESDVQVAWVNSITSRSKALEGKKVLLVLLGITFGLRLYAVLMAKAIANDSAFYGFMARDFLNGHFPKALSSVYHPFYPFLIFLISPDPTHVEITGRLLSLIFGSLALAPVYFLVREESGPVEAFFAGLFYAFQPYLVTYGGMFLSEATYSGLLTLSVYFFWTGLKKKAMFRSVLSGLFLALAYLTRPEGIGYIVVFLLWGFFDGGLRKEWLRKSFFILGLMLVFVILALAYIVYIHSQGGQWVFTRKALTIQPQMQALSEIIKNIYRFLPFTIYYYLRAYHFSLWLFLLAGLFIMIQKKFRYGWFLASLVGFHLVSLATLSHSTIRFSVPIIPLSLCLAVQLPQSLRPERRHREDQKKIGLWIRENTPKDAVIMSNSPIEAFYGEREFVYLPVEKSLVVYEKEGEKVEIMSYQEFLDFARAKKVRYILIDRYTSETAENFVRSIQPSDLKEIYRKGETVIYEVIY